ncbi:four helix bundle protein [Breznakiellaceae bacterium SP9]
MWKTELSGQNLERSCGNMAVENYQKMIVWQKSMDLAIEVYTLTSKLSREEIYSLTSQMRRTTVSIPSNIAEGQGRNSRKEFVRFLAIAKGSKAELETQLLLCVKIGYLAATDINQALSLAEEISKILSALIKNCSTKL